MTAKQQPSQTRAVLAMRYRLLVLCLFSIPTTQGFRWSPFSSKVTATSNANNNECSSDEDDSNDNNNNNNPRNNNDDKKKWWEGVNFEATPSSQPKSNYDSLLQQHDREVEEALSSLQLKPLLQVPCSVQLVSSSTTNNHHHHHRKNNHNKNRSFAIGAFLDTGAQRTCMSWEAVQRVGLAHLLDRRYSGQATGVGFCQVLGRIPAQTVLLHFGSGTATVVSSSNSSRNNNNNNDNNNNDNNNNDNSGEQKALIMKAPAITVLESTGTEGVELLLGLDFLREAKAVIDLQEECLRLIRSTSIKGGGKMEQTIITVPFIRPRQKLSLESNDNMGRAKHDYYDNNDEEDNSDYENGSDVEEDDEETLDLSGL